LSQSTAADLTYMGRCYEAVYADRDATLKHTHPCTLLRGRTY